MRSRNPHTRRERRNWHRCTVGLALAAGLAAAVGAGLVGCGEGDSQHRVLSIFFEGVPQPGQGSAPGAGGGPGASLGPGLAPTTIFYHAAYENRSCLPCHSGPGYLTPPDKTACGACHKPYFQVQTDEWQHGPVAAGQCGFCHQPHTSPYRHLLTKPVPDLCFQCHDRHTLTKPYHATADKKACTACHDSHLAGNRKLLMDAAGWKRRQSLAAPPAGGQP